MRAESPHTLSRLDTARALIAPVLLALVALVQCWLVLRHDLSPWKGGGFGMFSSLDRIVNRTVFAYLDDGARRQAIDVQRLPEVAKLASQVRTLPAPEPLYRLAEQLARLPWSRRGADGQAVVARVPDGTLQPVRVAGVQVVVWRNVAHPDQRTVGRERLARAEWRPR